MVRHTAGKAAKRIFSRTMVNSASKRRKHRKWRNVQEALKTAKELKSSRRKKLAREVHIRGRAEKRRENWRRKKVRTATQKARVS